MIVDEKDLPCTLRKQAVEPEAGWSLRKISSQQGAWKGTSPSSSGLYSIAMLVLVLVLCLCLFLCVCVCRSETRLLNKQSKYQPANQPSARQRGRPYTTPFGVLYNTDKREGRGQVTLGQGKF